MPTTVLRDDRQGAVARRAYEGAASAGLHGWLTGGDAVNRAGGSPSGHAAELVSAFVASGGALASLRDPAHHGLLAEVRSTFAELDCGTVSQSDLSARRAVMTAIADGLRQHGRCAITARGPDGTLLGLLTHLEHTPRRGGIPLLGLATTAEQRGAGAGLIAALATYALASAADVVVELPEREALPYWHNMGFVARPDGWRGLRLPADSVAALARAVQPAMTTPAPRAPYARDLG